MKSSSSRLVASFVALIAVVSAVFVYAFRSAPPSSATTSSTSDASTLPVTQTPSDMPQSASSGKYKDGTYKAVGTYDTPEGEESVTVSLTLKDGVVSDANVTANATGGRSLRYQQMFIGGYKAVVVGKSIEALSVGKVSGSSLTPIGFNNALSQIKTQAAQA